MVILRVAVISNSHTSNHAVSKDAALLFSWARVGPMGICHVYSTMTFRQDSVHDTRARCQSVTSERQIWTSFRIIERYHPNFLWRLRTTISFVIYVGPIANSCRWLAKYLGHIYSTKICPLVFECVWLGCFSRQSWRRAKLKNPNRYTVVPQEVLVIPYILSNSTQAQKGNYATSR
jgi:hypothetical protein